MDRPINHDVLIVARVAGGPARAWAAFAAGPGAPRPIGLAVAGPVSAAAPALLTIGPSRPTPVGSRREVRDADGALLGELEHRLHLSLVRSPWAVVGPDGAGVLAWTREPSASRALTRRAVPRMVPRTTILVGQRAEAEVVPAPGGPGRWQVDLGRVPPAVLDRRLALALLVALDAVRR